MYGVWVVGTCMGSLSKLPHHPLSTLSLNKAQTRVLIGPGATDCIPIHLSFTTRLVPCRSILGYSMYLHVPSAASAHCHIDVALQSSCMLM